MHSDCMKCIPALGKDTHAPEAKPTINMQRKANVLGPRSALAHTCACAHKNPQDYQSEAQLSFMAVLSDLK